MKVQKVSYIVKVYFWRAGDLFRIEPVLQAWRVLGLPLWILQAGLMESLDQPRSVSGSQPVDDPGWKLALRVAVGHVAEPAPLAGVRGSERFDDKSWNETPEVMSAVGLGSRGRIDHEPIQKIFW